MSTLLDRAAGIGRGPASAPAAGPAMAVGAGVRAAGQAAAASLVIVLVPAVVGWAAGSADHARWGVPVRVAVDAWLLAHHTGIAVAGGHVGLVPLGLLLVPLTACWLAGVRLARSLDPNGEAIRAGLGRAPPAFPPVAALVSFAATYAGLATLVAAAVVTDAARPLAAQALLGSLAVAFAGVLPGAAAWAAGGRRAGVRFLGARLPLPDAVRPTVSAWTAPAGWALAVVLSGGLLLVAASVILGWDRALDLHRALDPGVAGGTVLLLAQLAVLPNLAVWGAAVLAGPGFAVGTSTSVTAAGSILGPLPAVPVLGALPVPGTHGGWWWCLLAVPVVAGVAAGVRIDRSAEPSILRRLLAAVGAAGSAGLVLLVLAWLSGGPAGPGRLAQTGPSPWRVGLAAGGEIAVGAAVAVLALAGCRWCLQWVSRRRAGLGAG